jgi:16S rRNA (adenine1518-N6/adenine1519-N6)-dimethyltransferase
MLAKKSLGQNFLKNRKVAEKIVESAFIGSGESVLEIGPGGGILTEALLNRGARVLAIEKDRRLIPILKDKFAKEILSGRLEVVEADILDFDPNTLLDSELCRGKNYKLIANIPYYITGEIIRKFLTTLHQPVSMVLLVQKEVGERITARDGKESILSISVKAYGEPEYVETVKRGNFSPIPKVDSAIISINGISNRFFSDFGPDDFFKIVRAGFAQKRKKLISNLSRIFGKEKIAGIFDSLGLAENSRAEELSLSDWLRIVRLINS